ncbi:hypothetical protein L6164_031220 [Bauhinia variegata]|uniref:Uncharacterized protein n=1 Tax=Bauhinia variegata TaxID=167791 RepID=A0ACB9LG41_BAUVA|nr:hypothetical protein L6164_031220 [Bauhinia variegata]
MILTAFSLRNEGSEDQKTNLLEARGIGLAVFLSNRNAWAPMDISWNCFGEGLCCKSSVLDVAKTKQNALLIYLYDQSSKSYTNKKVEPLFPPSLFFAFLSHVVETEQMTKFSTNIVLCYCLFGAKILGFEILYSKGYCHSLLLLQALKKKSSHKER